MKLLFLDTETNGLPKNRYAPYTSTHLWPTILQISWQLVDSETWETLSEFDSFIKLREEWNKDAERVHQIPESIVRRFGKDPDFVLKEFCSVIAECDVVITHNLMFDKTVIQCELQRLKETGASINVRAIWANKIREICTMNVTRKYCGIKFPNSDDYKYPKLNELYSRLFDKKYDISGASLHNSKHDVSCLIMCVKHMVQGDFPDLLK